MAYEWNGPAPKTYFYIFGGRTADLALFPNHLVGAPWSESMMVANGIGEGSYSTRRVDAGAWLSSWEDRDKLGRTTFAAETFTHDSATLPTDKPPTIVGQGIEYDAFGRTIRQSLPTGAKTNIFAYCQPTDMRKGYKGLCSLVRESPRERPLCLADDYRR